jgi:cytochrome P450
MDLIGPSRETGDEDLYWDPFDKSLRVNPHPVWRRLRDEAPVYFNDRHDFFALSRYEDVDQANRSPKIFSSAHTTVLEMMSSDIVAMPGMMIFTDPPEHTRLRRLVNKAFTPRRIAEMEKDIRTLCVRLLDATRGRPSFDYVQDFGALLPANVIATFLGVPETDREEVRHTIDQMFFLDEQTGMDNDVSAAAGATLYAYVSQQLDERRSHPRDDLMTDLVEAEILEVNGSGRRLTPEEAVNFAVLLVAAGTETVARLIGWAGVELATYPDQRSELVADLSLVPNTVEELLRFEAPSPVNGRWTTADVELHGVVIPANSKVMLLTGSAGRDERVYPDPDRFDIHRQLDRHMSFGYGVHLCIGAALARMEGKIAIEETLRRYPNWEVDLDNAVMLFTSTVRGYSKLPITVAETPKWASTASTA